MFSICASKICCSPDHLAFGTEREEFERSECQQKYESPKINEPCSHNPPCLRGKNKGPEPKATASARQAKKAGMKPDPTMKRKRSDNDLKVGMRAKQLKQSLGNAKAAIQKAQKTVATIIARRIGSLKTTKRNEL